MSGSSWGAIELGPQTSFIDQPYVEVEMFDGPVGLGPYDSAYGMGIYPYNYMLLDTGANSILVVSDAAAELESNGYQTEGIYWEQGVAGYTEFDVGAPYRFDIKGSDGVTRTLPQSADQVRILSGPDVHLVDNPASQGGIPGIVGMPAMIDRVTTLDMTGWVGVSDIFEMGPIEVRFKAIGEDVPPDNGHRYSVALDTRVTFDPAAGLPPDSPPDAPLPVWAPIPFMTGVAAHKGVEQSGGFLLDTGAQISMVSEAIAFDIGLDANDDGSLLDDAIYTLPIGGIGGTVEVPVLVVEEFRLPTEEGVDLVWRVPDPERYVPVMPRGGATQVDENGGFDTYEVVLAGQPTADVTIALDNPDGQLIAEDAASPGNGFLVFSSSNWDTPQVVQVSAVDDGSVEGPHSGAILHTVSSTDADFDGAPMETVVVDVTDNDVSGPGVRITPSGGSRSNSSASGFAISFPPLSRLHTNPRLGSRFISSDPA